MNNRLRRLRTSQWAAPPVKVELVHLPPSQQPALSPASSTPSASPASSPRPPDLARHQRKCAVCRHPDRDAIEEAFIHWHSPASIADDYEMSDDSIYRHAYATGLDAIRSRNLRFALEHIIQDAELVMPTADSIVRAARAYTRINHAGEWVEPPTHVIISSGSVCHPQESRAATGHSSLPSSNRATQELKNDPTR